MDRAIDESDAVADAYYDAWAKNALHYGEQIAARITEKRLLREEAREDARGVHPEEAARVRPRRGAGLPVRGRRAARHAREPRGSDRRLRPAREHAGDLGLRRRRGLARRGHGQRDRRRDPRRGADPLLRPGAARRDRRRGGGELPGAAPARAQGRHDPRGGRRVPQHPALRRADRRHLPARAAALLARHRAVRDLVGPAHGEGRDGPDPRARRGHRRRSRAATSTW